jgi:hypothetical protein
MSGVAIVSVNHSNGSVIYATLNVIHFLMQSNNHANQTAVQHGSNQAWHVWGGTFPPQASTFEPMTGCAYYFTL